MRLCWWSLRFDGQCTRRRQPIVRCVGLDERGYSIEVGDSRRDYDIVNCFPEIDVDAYVCTAGNSNIIVLWHGTVDGGMRLREQLKRNQAVVRLGTSMMTRGGYNSQCSHPRFPL